MDKKTLMIGGGVAALALVGIYFATRNDASAAPGPSPEPGIDDANAPVPPPTLKSEGVVAQTTSDKALHGPQAAVELAVVARVADPKKNLSAAVGKVYGANAHLAPAAWAKIVDNVVAKFSRLRVPKADRASYEKAIQRGLKVTAAPTTAASSGGWLKGAAGSAIDAGAGAGAGAAASALRKSLFGLNGLAGLHRGWRYI